LIRWLIALILLAGIARASDTTLTNLSIDAYVRNNYGNDTNWVIGTATGIYSTDTSGDKYGMLIKWNLSFIPSGSTIDSVLVTMYGTGEGEDVGVVRLLTDWIEGDLNGDTVLNPGEYGATWNYSKQYYPGEGTNTTWASGSFSVSDFTSPTAFFGEDTTDTAPNNYVVTFWGAGMKSLFSGWVNGTYPNYGFGLYSVDGTSMNFRSHESASLKPLLYIAWTEGTPTSKAKHLGHVNLEKVKP